MQTPRSSRFNLSQVDLLVTASGSNDRFFRMEYDVVDTSIVAGQLVNDAPAGRVPDVDVAIGRSSRNSVAIS